MKPWKLIAGTVIFLVLLFGGFYFSITILNADLYGRLIETKSKNVNDSLPTVTFILHKHLIEENAVEASIIVQYDRSSFFANNPEKKLKIVTSISDGGPYNISGIVTTFCTIDSVTRDIHGWSPSGYELGRMQFPTTPSLGGYPFDNISIRPMISLYVNGIYSPCNVSVQKRIPGKLLIMTSEGGAETFELTRTTTEKTLVIVASAIFFLLALIVTYGLIKNKEGLSSTNELIAVAGYLLATAGFREILGLNRNSGISALETFVILVPLVFLFVGFVYSHFRSSRKK